MTDEPQIEVAELTRSARRMLLEWLGDARASGIDVDEPATIQAVYDNYFEQVLDTAPEDRTDPTPVLTMIGIALGEHLTRTTRLQWRVVTDLQGTDLALVDPVEDAVIFPVDPVAQHWAAQRAGWLVDLAAQLRVDFAAAEPI